MDDMDRRAFFRAGTHKLTETVVEETDKHVKQRAQHWIRPPFALDELDFLTTCTRCNDCVEACPHDVIFSLSARLGATVMDTPALDLLHKGCHLCEDWPCVEACTPNALTLANPAQDGSLPTPLLATVNINTQTCLPYLGPECGACASSCPISGALSWQAQKPWVDATKCTGCGLCREACIVDPKAVDIRSVYWNVC